MALPAWDSQSLVGPRPSTRSTTNRHRPRDGQTLRPALPELLLPARCDPPVESHLWQRRLLPVSVRGAIGGTRGRWSRSLRASSPPAWARSLRCSRSSATSLRRACCRFPRPGALPGTGFLPTVVRAPRHWCRSWTTPSWRSVGAAYPAKDRLMRAAAFSPVLPTPRRIQCLGGSAVSLPISGDVFMGDPSGPAAGFHRRDSRCPHRPSVRRWRASSPSVGERLQLVARDAAKVAVVEADLIARGAAHVATTIADLDDTADHAALVKRWQKSHRLLSVSMGRCRIRRHPKRTWAVAERALHTNFSQCRIAVDRDRQPLRDGRSRPHRGGDLRRR